MKSRQQNANAGSSEQQFFEEAFHTPSSPCVYAFDLNITDSDSGASSNKRPPRVKKPDMKKKNDEQIAKVGCGVRVVAVQKKSEIKEREFLCDVGTWLHLIMGEEENEIKENEFLCGVGTWLYLTVGVSIELCSLWENFELLLSSGSKVVDWSIVLTLIKLLNKLNEKETRFFFLVIADVYLTVNAYIMSFCNIFQLFWQDSFELPRGEPSRDADIELGQQPPISAAEQGLEGFFKQVQVIEKQVDKLSTLLKNLQVHIFKSLTFAHFHIHYAWLAYIHLKLYYEIGPIEYLAFISHREFANERSKTFTKASDMKAIKQQMQKDIDEAGKIARLTKSKLEELDQDEIISCAWHFVAAEH
ncbi:hypothetical protein ZIOFF_042405 [Zingiber officinale]|uniref:Syntaxin N-terminal domain-containing protein n=1 Tax=Zingiber officinale TaxID=94328 RepID=A0A8J5FRL7_ZINOF|nr:hypothetical protein ZIOFF_042405 [Zingiber officinale]